MKQANPGVPEGSEIISIQSPFAGWASNITGAGATNHYTATVQGIESTLIKPTSGNYAESNGISLFRKERFGHISPGPVWAAVGDSNGYITNLALNGFTASTGDIYVVLKNGRLVRILANQGATANHWDPNVASSTHSGHSVQATNNGDNLIMFDYQATPVEFVLWSWEDSTDADIDVYSIGGNTQTNNWFSGLSGSAVLRKGVPHKIIKGPDGNVYILDGSKIRQVNVTGALTSATLGNVLDLGADFTAQSICAFKNYVAIIASKTAGAYTGVGRGETWVFLWQGLTSTVNGVTSVAADYKYPIQDNFGNGIFFDGEVLFAFTNGRNNSSKIWEYTSKGFAKVFETPLIASSTNSIQGSLESYQDGLMVAAMKPNNDSGYLFRFYKGGFHCEAQMGDGVNTANDVGMVKNLYNDYLYVGAKYGSSTYVIWTTYNQQSTYQVNADFRTILLDSGILGRRMYPLGFKGTLNRIQIFLSQWGTGASLTLSLFKDYDSFGTGPGSTNDKLNLLLDTDATTANSTSHKAYPVGTTEIDISDISIANLSSFYMNIRFTHASSSNTAAIIRRMVLYWTPSQ